MIAGHLTLTLKSSNKTAEKCTLCEYYTTVITM